MTEQIIDTIETPVTLPLTAAQRGIYYAQQIDPDVPMSVAAFVEFHGDVDAALMERAVAETAGETESGLLRLIDNGDDEPTVLVDTDRRVELGRRDFSHLRDPRGAALKWIDEHRSHVPDLFTDPLLQTYLLKLGPHHSIWYCWGHHLAFDGYAAMYMMVRVAQRYTASAESGGLPAATIATMSDIAEIDADYRSSQRFTDDRDYWSGHLHADDGTLPTTSFAARTDVAAPVATVVSAALDDDVVEAIRTRATELEVRPASVITAAVALYLARFNNTDDAMLSLPVAVRDSDILRTSAGLTSNVVPVLAGIDDADGPRRVDDFIRAVNAEIKQAVRHQRFRHEDLTGDVLGAAGGRRGFFGPMVNVMLFFKHIDFGSLRGELNILSTGPVEDASVNVYDTMFGGMSLDLEANPNVYDDVDVETHHQRLCDFLVRFVRSASDAAVTDLALTPTDEFDRLAESTTGATAAPTESTVTALLARAADEFAEETALIDPDGESLTYRQVRQRVCAIAAALRERGIGAESVVGVMLPRSVDQQIALQAVITAGAIFVPIAPDEPAQRRDHILDIAQPDLVIVAADSEPMTATTTATLDELQAAAPAGITSPVAPHPDNGAYLLFTSGSTGQPKGVLISHRSLVNRLEWMQDTYALTPQDRVLQKTPASFDVSVWEYFWPLITGAALVVAEPDGHRDPWYLRRVIAETGVTALHFVPSMLTAFTEVLGPDEQTPEALTSLRLIFTSGEALTPQTVAAAAAVTTAPIHNLYGPTEAAIDVTFHNDCAPTDPVIPIGRPVANTSVYVLDRRLTPLPQGAVGELYLGGVQLARGYRARPDLTADRFVPSPFGTGERLYRTGDLVRRRRDGELEYLGRSDSQVKIRGQRVELGEIEAALAALSGIRSAGVVLRDDLLAEPVVIGYVSGDGLDDRDLRAELSQTLPAHMIPTVVMVCDVLPTTANGKLDRRALPAPDLTGDRDAEHVAPADAVEQLVHDTVCAVLHLDQISMTAGFFDRGGNSLAATRVAARLSAATGVRIGIRAVFDAGDIAAIARELRVLGVDDVRTPTRTRHVDIDGPVALSPAQRRLWLAARLDPAGAASYNIPFTVRLIGDLDVSALTAALNDVVARHEPLRTTVAEDSGRTTSNAPGHVAYQQVHAADGELVEVAVSDGPGNETIREFAARPFDLRTDLPIRARIIRHGDNDHSEDDHSEGDHTLVVVIHHIAADGWSLGPLAADLATAYQARHAGSAPDWAALPTTYRQASADALAWLDDPESSAREQIDFWADALADAPVDTELPYDHAPANGNAPAGDRQDENHSRTGACVTARVDAQTRGRLSELAQRYDTTDFMVVHAAVAALLRTMSRSDDIVVGTPVSGRGTNDLDPLIGMFVNTLPLRTPVDKAVSFADLLGVVRDRDLAAFDHADIPFDRLVTELNPPRSSSGQPFFDVTVALEDADRISLDFAALSATAARIDTATTKFDLEFTFTDHSARSNQDRGMDLAITYASARFDRATVRSLAARCVRLLQTVAADPTTSVGDACILAPAERLDLVPAVGAGSRPVEHLSQLLDAAVAAEPHRPAIVDTTDRRVSYQDLDEAANRLARLLIDVGAGPERYVAVSLPRGVDWIVALWAVAKSGAAWVPVDPAYPPARTEFMLTDSGAAILVTDTDSRSGLPTLDGVTTIVLDDAGVAGERADRSPAPIDDADRRGEIDVDQPAYLIYTSGTTGRPKGVVVSHRGLADFAAEQVSHFALTPDSRTLHLASPSFDASVLEVIMAVSAAASMHIVPPGVVGGTELATLMADAGITHAFLTPSLLTTMSPDDVPQLQTLVIGGEHPNAEAVRRWSTGRRLINAYGPTEATVVATMSTEIEPDDSVTIGRPIRGVSALVLDERLRPVAPGTVGELYLCGPHLARGYHGVRPLTSKRFVANPFAEPGERMYRTGDLVRWRADHTLEFRGRADHQTKVRGHRIELGEIDAALAADDAVRDAVTIVVGEGEAARLVAYVTAADEILDTAATRALRERLTAALPRHMIPSTIVALEEIPTTPIGKVDLRALPAPDLTGDREHTPPQNAAESTVADAVATILHLDAADIGREDDFFELGGNSLLATQLVGELEQHTQSRIGVRSLFDDPRILAIAALLGDLGDAVAAPPRVALEHRDDNTDVDPGPAQQQLWFLNQLDDPSHSSGAYNIAFALDLRGDLDVAALAGALRHAIGRHEPLRTRYPAQDGRPTLDVLDDETNSAGFDAAEWAVVPVLDEQAWQRQARRLAAKPFDLTQDTPLRTALHRIADGTEQATVHRLSIVVHHIAADGASMGPLARDIGSAYADLHAGRPIRQSPPSVTYRDYLRWQDRSLAAPATGDTDRTRRQELTEWWRTELDGISHAPILAPDAPPADDAEPSGAGIVEVPFDDELRTALRAVAGRDTTEFMLVHAVLATLLHRLHADPAVHVGTGRSDIVIGTPVAGRNDPRLADNVGMFVNSVPLRASVDSTRSFTDLLADIRRADLDALSHADMPFEQLVAALAPPRTGRHPLFGIALTFDDLPLSDGNSIDLDGITATAREVETASARFDLELRIRSGVARFTYDTGQYTQGRIADLADRFTSLARQIADDPSTPVGDYCLTRSINRPGSRTGNAGVTPARHLADLVDDAVRSRPDAVALDDGATTMTYREAGAVSDRWARTLIDYGVGPDDVVAVAVERSIDSVLATWSVAKSGAAILPIDPRYPAERIRHMLSDSDALLGITTPAAFDSLPHDRWWLTTADLASGQAGPTARRPRHMDTCAYLIYTSGTTGTPKGVSVTHRGLAAFAGTQTRRYGVGPQSRTLHFASPSFDAAMLELLLALDAAATMVIAPPTIYGGDELIDFVAENAVTHMFVTPAAISAATPRELPQLETLAVGGESFGRELVARWGADRTFLNCYGPTETTIVATMSALQPGDPITIGIPVDDCTPMVLDARLRPLPPYTPGDLYLCGPGLARGYLDRPTATATRFVAAADGSGERMYRTGDLASADLDGVLTYHGRSDRQVKVRGFRIELDELDSTLAGHPAVAAAVTVTDGSGDAARLVSYVTAHEGACADPRELTEYMTHRLPRQMVPSAVMVIDEIPMTVNGKVDRRALPAPDRAEPVAARAPRTPAERVLAGLVADALGIAAGSVGPADDFFDLGGTSLQATTLVSRINDVHRGEPIRVRAVFDNPTVEGLAQLLVVEDDSLLPVVEDDSLLPDIDDAGTTEPTDALPVPEGAQRVEIPLAPMQRRLWSLHRSSPDAVEYAMGFALRLHGSLNTSALQQALCDVVSRHAALRTVYPERSDGPVGIVLDDCEAVVGTLEPVVGDPAAAVTELVARPFDLTVDAPLRVALTTGPVRGDDAAESDVESVDHTLVLVIHHIAADGGSMPIIIGDLLDAYRRRVRADQPLERWAAASPDYRDYAAAAPDADADVQFWSERLAGAPAETSVAADPARAGHTGGGTVSLPIDAELRDEIAAFSRSHSTTPFTVVHTAAAALLNRLGAGDDLVIGTPVDSRAHAGGADDFRGVVGMFVNTVALRTFVDSTSTVATLLESVRNDDLDAWDHLSAPFDDVVAAVNPPRLPGRYPLFQVALSVHDFADSIAGEQLPISDDLVGEIAEVDAQTAKFDLQFTVTGMNSQAAQPNLAITFARGRYDADDAEQLGARLLRVLRAMIADPERVIGDIRITDPLEAAALAPVSGSPAQRPRTFAALLDDAARRNPDGIALAAESADGQPVTLSYRELSERANRLARELLARGVADDPETVVAMAMRRSVDAIVAIWAIVRTGAAYVPIDPTYPAQRIAHMLDDSGARLVVTTTSDADALTAEVMATGTPVLAVDDEDMRRRIEDQSADPVTDAERRRPIAVDQLAYIIYTSGSTGTPKGVLVPHRGLGAVHDELSARFHPVAESRVLHFASPSFDASVLEFLFAAAGAATLVLAPTSVYGGDDLAAFIDRMGVTHAFITPAAVASMSPDAVPTLTALAVGGEAVAPDLVRTWSPGRTLINVYGPTETTVITTGSEPLTPADHVTIGGPNNGVGAVVLDSRLHPVPVGVAGELYLLGGQVTRGYHNRNRLTATRFVAAPPVLGECFAGQRMYRTGDLVRPTASGTLDYVGRADNQVQVRGFRVELGEIDDVLTGQPQVRAAVTVADTSGSAAVLHSYVTASADKPAIDAGALRRAIAHQLPRHMVPATITVLDALPLTPVGKVDRRALPQPQAPAVSTASSRSGSAPEGTGELPQQIAAIFAEVLGVDAVAPDDNFFDVGGNSLLATKVVSKLREADYQLSVPDVFAAGTPAELAEALTADDAGQSGSAALAPLLTLRRGAPGSQSAPLFVIHPAIGLAWSFSTLLPYVDDDRAVYGLQNPALSGAQPATDIGALAADYVRRIREVAPQGPYRLLGWSLGGLIAQEVGVALQRAGEEVEQLVLLDSYVLADHPDLVRPESMAELLGEFGVDTSQLPAEPDLAAVAQAVRAGGGPLADLSDADLEAIHDTFTGAGSLAAGWQPRSFVGDAVFVTATDSDTGVCARSDWVDRITGTVADVRVDCTHARMLLAENVSHYGHVVDADSAAPLRPARRRGTHRKESQ